MLKMYYYNIFVWNLIVSVGKHDTSEELVDDDLPTLDPIIEQGMHII